MSSDFALQVQNLGKCYHIYRRPRDRLLQFVCRGYRRFYREFWALRDFSLNVKKGATIGVIGRNGSGKSTLLQLICGTLTATTGVIDVAGRVAALLELGAGFNPEFTGRENIYMNAAILGLSRRAIDDRFDALVHFADIGDFLDQPVKTYSSGMYIRLAFSVAVHTDPDILVVDEALAVGDIRFQAKCFRKFDEFRDAGRTILFVSHSTEQIVRHCSEAVLLEEGRILLHGDPKTVSNHYLDLAFGVKQEHADLTPPPPIGINALAAPPDDARVPPPIVASAAPPQSLPALFNQPPGRYESRPAYNPHEYRWGSRTAQIVDFVLQSPAGLHVNRIDSADELLLHVRVCFIRDVARPIYGIYIKSPDGVTIAGFNSRDLQPRAPFAPRFPGDDIIVTFAFRPSLNTGDYFLSLGVAEDILGEVVPLDRRYDSIHIFVHSSGRTNGILDIPARIDTHPIPSSAPVPGAAPRVVSPSPAH